MKRLFLCTALLTLVCALINCSSESGAKTNEPISQGEDSPTKAYERLYAAVKSKNTDAIEASLSKKSIDFAKNAAAQYKKPLETVLENGFTGTTFAKSLPQIRDERVNGDMGAVEVHNDKENKWEDLPFIRENGVWKLAVGDVFAGTWKSPGKSQSEKEREASNTLNKIVPTNLNPGANNSSNRVRPMTPLPAPTNSNISPKFR